jgi:multiple sugar transport system permease protein
MKMNRQPRNSQAFVSRRMAPRTAALYAVCTVLAVAFLFPILWSAITSVKPPAEASAVPPTFLPSRLSFANYQKINVYGAGLFRYVFNSAAVALMTVLGAIVLSVLSGYGFARFNFRGKNLMFILILATLMIPFQSILTPLFLVLHTLGLINTLVGLALVYTTFQLPLGVFIMRNTFETVPRELEEAALLDGCTSLSMLYRLMLRLVRPGIITVSVYAFLNSWNEFLAALILMSEEGKFTLPILLSNSRSGHFGLTDWGALQAGVVVSILPCIILFVIIQRYYLQGLTSGAVKA